MPRAWRPGEPGLCTHQAWIGDPIYKQCSIQRICLQLYSSSFCEELWQPMGKHADRAQSFDHSMPAGHRARPPASTGSRAHAGKMLNGSAPFSAVRPVALYAWTALSDAQRRWYRQCRGRSVLVTAMEAHDPQYTVRDDCPFAWARPLRYLVPQAHQNLH